MADKIEIEFTQNDFFALLFRPSWLRLILALNAFLGLIALEVAWKKLR